MQRYKVLISLIVLGFSLATLVPAQLIAFEPVSATVTASSRTYISGSSSDRPGRSRYDFAYEYTYSNQRYTSKRYTYSHRNRSIAVCHYRVGQTITAYVDGNNPAYALINRQVSGFIYGIAVIGSLMLLHCGLDVLVYRSEPPQPWLSALYRWLGMLIGLAVLGGGLGGGIYTLVTVATQSCPNPGY
jgi:hypothetical protein